MITVCWDVTKNKVFHQQNDVKCTKAGASLTVPPQIAGLLGSFLLTQNASGISARESVFCCHMLRPQANPRGSFHLASAEKLIIPCSISSAWIPTEDKILCFTVMKLTFTN